MNNTQQPEKSSAAPEEEGAANPAPSTDTAADDRTDAETVSLQQQLAAKLSNNPVKQIAARAIIQAQRKRAKRWENENRRAFRSCGDIDTIIAAECDTTGCTESDAIRSLLRRAGGLNRVVIRPSAPPEALAKVISSLNELARAVRSVRSRVNAPILDTGDAELAALLKDWRRESVELPPKLTAIAKEAQTVIAVATALTPEDVRLIQGLENLIKSEVKVLQEKPEGEKAKFKSMIQRRVALINVLVALGIFQAVDSCPPQK